MLTDSQHKNLTAVSDAGGAIVDRGRGYFARGRGYPIRGLSGVTLRNLVGAGMLTRARQFGCTVYEITTAGRAVLNEAGI